MRSRALLSESCGRPVSSERAENGDLLRLDAPNTFRSVLEITGDFPLAFCVHSNA